MPEPELHDAVKCPICWQESDLTPTQLATIVDHIANFKALAASEQSRVNFDHHTP
jgi:hypothetical protein